MGIVEFLERLVFEEDRYQEFARTELESIRAYTQKIHGQEREVVRPLVAKRLKFAIQTATNQGGEDAYRCAMALWQRSKALFPKWITDQDCSVCSEDVERSRPHPRIARQPTMTTSAKPVGASQNSG